MLSPTNIGVSVRAETPALRWMDMTQPDSEAHRNIPKGTFERPVSRRTVLTGALASGTLVFGPATGRAAAQRDGGSLHPGVPVVDSEDPDPDPAIVIDHLDVPIGDWIVYGDETVADQNPSYDPEDPVVIVVFEHHLDSGWTGWRQARPGTLFDGVVTRGIKFHAFPRARLDRHRSVPSGPGDVTGNSEPATDRNGDGRYEDVNGDGTFGILDVAALLSVFDDIGEEERQYFDFDEQGDVDILDVATLLDKL